MHAEQHRDDSLDLDASCRAEVVLSLYDVSSSGQSVAVNLYFLGVAMRSLMQDCREDICGLRRGRHGRP